MEYIIDDKEFLNREQSLETIKREFFEEAMDSKPDAVKQIDELFKNADSVDETSDRLISSLSML